MTVENPNRRASPESVEELNQIGRIATPITSVTKPPELLAKRLNRLASKHRKKMKTAQRVSADNTVDSFKEWVEQNKGVKGKSGVFDPEQMKLLDANNPKDNQRLQKLFGSKGRKIGFNSITDTRKGPENDIGLIRTQLKQIENSGGVAALGFDEGSLEAVRISTGIRDKDILRELQPSQRSTGILTPNEKFKIKPNPNFRNI